MSYASVGPAPKPDKGNLSGGVLLLLLILLSLCDAVGKTYVPKCLRSILASPKNRCLQFLVLPETGVSAVTRKHGSIAAPARS